MAAQTSRRHRNDTEGRESKRRNSVVTVREVRLKRDSSQSPGQSRFQRTRSVSDGKVAHKEASRPRRKSESILRLPIFRKSLHTRQQSTTRRHSDAKGTHRRPPSKQLEDRQENSRHKPLRSEKRRISETVVRESRGRPKVSRSESTQEMRRESSFRSFNDYSAARIPRRTSHDPPLIAEKPKRVERTASTTPRRAGRPPSIYSSLLGSHSPKSKSTPKSKEPEPQVECLACMSEFPASQIALLPCEHRMCDSCLRRLFTLSLTDAQHMPPKCCTSKPIPLKHVDKLFDQKFKRKWNQKNLEFSTKNRIYCPTKGCGTWIKPEEMKTDTTSEANRGRKYGKCSRCRLKVCCTCNGKWHASKTCPKDPDTLEFIAYAKEHGWQRCYNCSATVELKEGCNHMTCRCSAEFCMLCAAKWKTCDCPWFNYQAVEADRLNHMNIPQGPRMPIFHQMPGQAPRPQRNNNNRNDNQVHNAFAFGYQREMEMRREQVRRDEAMARRIQILTLQGDVDDVDDADIIDLEAGHAGGPVLDENFVRRAREILTQQLHPAQGEAVERLLNEHRRRDNNSNNAAPGPRQQPWQPPRPPTPSPSPRAQNETPPAPAPAPDPARIRPPLNRNNGLNSPRPRPRVTPPLQQQQQPQPMPAAPAPPTTGTAAQNRPAPIRRANTTATANPGRVRSPRQQLPRERNRSYNLEPIFMVLPTAPSPPPPNAPGSAAARAWNARAEARRASRLAGLRPDAGDAASNGSRVNQWRHWVAPDGEEM